MGEAPEGSLQLLWVDALDDVAHRGKGRSLFPPQAKVFFEHRKMNRDKAADVPVGCGIAQKAKMENSKT
ncbi:MAG: hypothetical protein ICV79_02380 [Flavisolibacter sp.]|nr:hypothetical protein [Flavisolibacter sp.]